MDMDGWMDGLIVFIAACVCVCVYMQFSELRRKLVLLVLSTDMSRHFGLLQDVRQVLRASRR